MDILCSLGHNSSAIGICDQNIIGYEEERFTRIKSDKIFPKNALEEVFKYMPASYDQENIIYFSHWYDNFDFHNVDNYDGYRYDKPFIQKLQREFKFEIQSLNSQFTHHDAHAYSVMCFYKSHTTNTLENKHIVVADGFGNKQEVISVYQIYNEKPTLLQRYFGYIKSLGLMYQYATSFLGMKENEDEYKLLGYESHIQQFDQNTLAKILDVVKEQTDDFIKKLELETHVICDKYKINLVDIEETKRKWHNLFNCIVNELMLHDIFQKRVAIAFIVQSILENTLLHIVNKFGITNALLSGGVFYNVKLNNAIMKCVQEICIMPVCGDQGATIGLYYATNNTFKFDNLTIGKRVLSRNKFPDNCTYTSNLRHVVDVAYQKIQNDEIVQIVSNDMEYGPRALLNSSTLAIPTSENVKVINAINGRNTVMPFAPCIAEDKLDVFFSNKQIKKVVGSHHYMIATLDYNEAIYSNSNMFTKYNGVMHKYPLTNEYSGRPQVMKKTHYLYQLIEKLGKIDINMLIQTSFNIHGKPIVFSLDQIFGDFDFQLNNKMQLNIKKPISLIIYDHNI